ncbi:MAG: hypothetical protein LBQ12_15305, partial [Deltaproteobacteria bacterium]|nr:hypothetical protein [Deltaproteobacteria bacterium]
MATSSILPLWQKDSFLPGGLAWLKRDADEARETGVSLEAKLQGLSGRSMSPDGFRDFMARLED